MNRNHKRKMQRNKLLFNSISIMKPEDRTEKDHIICHLIYDYDFLYTQYQDILKKYNVLKKEANTLNLSIVKRDRIIKSLKFDSDMFQHFVKGLLTSPAQYKESNK